MQVIAFRTVSENDLWCVERDVKPYSLTHSPTLVRTAYKAGLVNDDAMRSGVQFFSSVFLTSSVSKSNIFLIGFPHVRFRSIFPSSTVFSLQRTVIYLEYTVSSCLDVAWWCGPENVVLAPGSKLHVLQLLYSCWSSYLAPDPHLKRMLTFFLASRFLSRKSYTPDKCFTIMFFKPFEMFPRNNSPLLIKAAFAAAILLLIAFCRSSSASLRSA